jgi:hypothetical protein
MLEDDGTKWLTVGDLIGLLKGLSQESRATVNGVGNILILSADGERALAYVDFSSIGEVITIE